MGSTIVAARKVAALETKGTVFYALFESTYESNVFPQTPSWSCRYFGTAEGCMRRIICDAAVAEGGMLKEHSGWVSPSAYIKHWRDELERPVPLVCTEVSAAFGTGFYSIKADKRQGVEEILNRHGLAVGLNNNFVIDLKVSPEALQELLAANLFPAWYVFDVKDAGKDVDVRLGYTPRQRKADVLPLPVQVVYLDMKNKEERDYWIVRGESRAEPSGWAYSTIEKLISEYAVLAERDNPGSAEAMIRVIRETVKNAQALPDHQPVSIYRDRGSYAWNQSCFDELAKKLQRACSEISTTVGEILQSDAAYYFKQLPEQMVCFPGIARNIKGEKAADRLAA